MTDAQFEKWAERKLRTFEQWVFACFTKEGRQKYVARQQRTAKGWMGLMAETPYMLSQHTGRRDFKMSTEDFTVDKTGEFLYVFARFTAPDGQQFEPTEGMVINVSNGEMSYI